MIQIEKFSSINDTKRLSMNLEKQRATDRLTVIEKKTKYLGLYNAPAMIVIGLGMFSKFVPDPGALHPLLENANVVNNALTIAIPWALVTAYISVKLSVEAYKLKKVISI